MKVNIIIPFYKNKETIANLIRSIDDQDYKDKDISIVIDGEDKDAEAFLIDLGYLSRQDIEIYSYEANKGASYARNYGAKNTNGDILFFIDADCRLYPGMLTECVKQLKKDKKIDFVYGNYRFDGSRSEFVSQPFDPYFMDIYNYIPTMSPVRREAFDRVGGFKEGQEYFQDYSLFYRLIKTGSTGKWINEFIFSTAVPTDDNISGKTEIPLPEKYHKFREEHGIKHRDLVVSTFGAPFQALQRAKMLDADYLGPLQGTKRALFPFNLPSPNWKATYVVGLYNQTLEALENHIALVKGKPIYHFIGTDTFQMYNYHSIAALKSIKSALKEQGAKLFANSGRMVKELKECGLDAELLYTPIYDMERFRCISQKPHRFTIGVYYSDTNPMHAIDGAGGMSNLPMILEVAKALPQFRFKFFGGKQISKSDNIEFCGHISNEKMPEFINSCNMLLRSTIHDGFPQLPIQFLLCGRKALVSCPDKELKYADKLSFEEWFSVKDFTYEDAKKEMMDKIMNIANKNYRLKSLSRKAHAYYSKLMSVDKFVNRIRKEIPNG